MTKQRCWEVTKEIKERDGDQERGGGGGAFSQACLRQCDMAHAINSGSVERPCLAICSGSGALAGVGVTSTPTNTTRLLTHTQKLPPLNPHKANLTPPRPSTLAWQTPGQARAHFHKTIAGQPAPVSAGWGQEGRVERRRAFLNNGPSDEKGPWWTWYTLQKRQHHGSPRAQSSSACG